MLKNAELKYNLELSNTIVIGDRHTDMIAAEQVGAIKILVKTGCGIESFDNNEWNSSICDYIAEDLLDAVKWITLSNYGGKNAYRRSTKNRLESY